MKSPFRSIRQSLFNEGKLLRYLGYAIGEIALIIIGILFALKINNMNEDRKAQVEFEIYVKQLKVDVQDSIKDVGLLLTRTESYKENCDNVLTFLDLEKFGSDELASLETGLDTLGNYNEVQVHVGLLGDIMNGNMDVLGRDRDLAKKAREMESNVERYLSNLEHIYNQIDLASDRINQFRGKATDDRPPSYILEQIRSSGEFKNSVQTITNRMSRVITVCGRIIQRLESFLAVLEEYE